MFETVVHEAQPHQPLAHQPVQHAPPQRSQGDALHAAHVGKKIGQIEQLELREADAPELGQRGRQHLHRAQLQRLHFVVVTVQPPIGVHHHLDAPCRALLHQLPEPLDSQTLGCVRRDHVRKPDAQRGTVSRHAFARPAN